jgi:hypothetical protein
MTYIQIELSAGNRGVYSTINVDGKITSGYETTDLDPVDFLIRRLLEMQGTRFAYDNYGSLSGGKA